MKVPLLGRLSTRIALAAAAVALATGFVISMAGYFAVQYQESQARDVIAAQHVRQQARRIADRLDVMTSGLRVAVDSSLMASALVDSAGKELYVQPFLNRLSVYPGMTASVYFVDYEGQVSMQSEGALPLGTTRDWLTRTVVAGREALHLAPSADGGALFYVVPLIYARTGRPEGALVAQVRLQDLVFASGSSLLIVDRPEPAMTLRQDATVPLDARLVDPPAGLVWRDQTLMSEIDASFSSRSGQVLGLGLALSLAAALILARPVARRTLRDVDRLITELEALGTQHDRQHRKISEFGSEEIRSIAKAVNTTLQALEASNKSYQRERELRMAGIIESSTDAIITLDSGHRIVQFNAAAALMFRIPADQALGGSVERFVPLAQRDRHDEMIRAFAASGDVTSRRMGRARSFSAARADGELFQAEATLTKARIDAQDYMTVLIRDITDQVTAEGERAARALAEAANKEKTAFLARMSHELRTPLNAIHGFAELMLRQQRPSSQAEHRQRLELIIGSSRRLLSLINDLLDVSRIELGELSVQVSRMEVMTVVRAAATELEDAARHAGVEIRLDMPREPRWAMADVGRLHQVISNLVSNAIKYNRRGGSVDILVATPADRLVLQVRDTGMGMGAEQLDALYQPFNRLGRDSQAQGTGIGLTISKHLVEVMGGTIEVQSTLGQGTCFTVTLEGSQAPVAAPARYEEPALIAPRDEVVGRLLYVEDEPINQLLLVSVMELRPAVTVSVAENGLTALEAVLRDPPDLMLVDMMLPDMHGTELARQLHERLGERCPKMIAYSANALVDDIAAARAAGFVHYMVKPTPADELLAVIDQMLIEARSATG